MENQQVPNSPQKNNTGTIIAVVIIIALLAGGAYALFNNKTTEQTTDTDQTNGSIENTTNDSMGQPSPTQATDVTATPSPTDAMDASVKTFTVSGQNFSFTPNQITVNKGDKVKIVFQNSGGFHDLVIDEFGVKTAQIASGASETVEFTADKTGSFEYYCSVGSHRQMGMKGTLIVK